MGEWKMMGTGYGAWSMRRAVDWRLRFCLFPKYCYLTGERIWFKWAYHGENWITGPGEPVVEQLWVERNKFLLWQLVQ